jgi:hypothetical protein
MLFLCSIARVLVIDCASPAISNDWLLAVIRRNDGDANVCCDGTAWTRGPGG